MSNLTLGLHCYFIRARQAGSKRYLLEHPSPVSLILIVITLDLLTAYSPLFNTYPTKPIIKPSL